MKIMANMDKKSQSKSKNEELKLLRSYFKEYLLYVSKLEPQLGIWQNIISSEFIKIQNTEEFKDAFAKRSKTDNRKWAGFLSLIRGYARLQGRDELTPDDVKAGSLMFQKSLSTLTGLIPKSSLRDGIDFDLLELHGQLLKQFDKGMGQGCTVNIKKARAIAKNFKRGKQFETLLKIKLSDGSMLIEDLGSGELLIKRN